MNITTYDSDDLEPAVKGFAVRDHFGPDPISGTA
jgi:hypothetical protein